MEYEDTEALLKGQVWIKKCQLQKQLEIWGKAKREAARRCKSDWGNDLGEKEAKISLVATSLRVQNGVNLSWVNMRAYNFFVSEPKFTTFFAERGRGGSWSLDSPIFDRSGNIRDQSLKLFKIAPNFGCFCHPKF